MSGTEIVYRERFGRSRYSHGNNDNGQLTTVQVEQPICRITNLVLGSSDPRKATFLVHGQEVPINGEAFMACCRTFGWTAPELFRSRAFDIETFLIGEAKRLVAIPAKEIGKRWETITDFAKLIGLKTNFINAIRRE